MNRRSFIRISSLSTGGLLVGTLIKVNKLESFEAADSWRPNLFIEINNDSQITLYSTQMELGQGTSDSFAQIVADELGAVFESIKVSFHATSPQLAEEARELGVKDNTGGSMGISHNWNGLRTAAASTRELLIKAASEKWSVKSSECFTENGFVALKNSNRRIPFGDIAHNASKLTLDETPKLKKRSEYKYIGKPLIGQKQRKVVTGTQQYSIDFSVPDMVYASIERTPVFRGRVKSFDGTDAKNLPGVLDVLEMEEVENNRFLGGVRSGVIVIATSSWAAMKGREKLKIEWDLGALVDKSDEDIVGELEAELTKASKRNLTVGDPGDSLQHGDYKEYSYYNSYQANVCMEPLNAVASYNDNRLDVWVGTQGQVVLHNRLAELFELPKERVTVHPFPSGGGFGRRYFTDFAEEAALVSKQVRKPVKLMWTREDTVKKNRYHDLTLQNWKAVLNAETQTVETLDYRGPSVSAPNAFRAFPYNIANQGFTKIDPTHWLTGNVSWRSVAAHPWILGLESVMDELAYEAKVDPLEFRLKHLQDNAELDLLYAAVPLYPGRLKKCFQLVAEKAEWGKKTKRKSGQGIAGCSYSTSYCALVADVSIVGKKIRIDKVTAAIDVGFAINPSQVRAQVEGSIVWGISALFNQINIKNGVTVQSNYHDYPLPKIQHTPEIEVHIIENEHAPSGAGEPAVPVTAPAILNAIYAATGERIRKIPLDLKQA